MSEMILVMVDECGDDVEIERFNIGNDLDEDYIDIWKSMKIDKAREQYPEARRFYFEDRDAMQKAVNMAVHDFFGDYDPWEDEDVEEDEDCGYESNCHCDTYGICGGYSCSNYAKCQGWVS